MWNKKVKSSKTVACLWCYYLFCEVFIFGKIVEDMISKITGTWLIVLLLSANLSAQVTSNVLFIDDFSTWDATKWPDITNNGFSHDAANLNLTAQGKNRTFSIATKSIRLKSAGNKLTFLEKRGNKTSNASCRVLVSSNGVDFNELTSYSLSAISTNWSKRELDLSGYNNLEVIVQFEFVVSGRWSRRWQIDDVSLLGSNVESPEGFTVSKLTSNYVELDWTLNSSNQPVIISQSASEVNGLPENGVEYDIATNNTLPDGSVVIYKGALTNFRHESLSEDTPYYYRIWSYAGTGVDTEYSLDKSLNTRTLSESTIFYEDFEDSNTYGHWTLDGPDEGNSWVIGNTEFFRGNSSAYVSNNGTDATYNNNQGRTTDIDLGQTIPIPAGYKSAELSFYWKGIAEPGYDGGGVREGDGRWSTDLIDQRSLSGQTTWVEEVVDITDFIGGNFDVRFNWYNDAYAGQNPSLCIDDIRITCSDVYRVQAFSGDPQSQQEVQLSWTKNVDNEDVVIAYSQYGIIGRPVNGVDYSIKIGEFLDGGGQIIYAGPASGCTHTGEFFGEVTYKIWSVNALHNYSSARLTTVHIPVVLPYTEDFEDDISEWNFNSGYDNAWVRGRAISNPGGTQAAYISNDMGITAGYDRASSSDTYLELDVDLRGFETAELKFYWQCRGGNSSTGEVYIGSNQLTSNGGRATYSNNTTWTEETISLNSYVGSIRKLRFRWDNWDSGSNPGFCIDDVSIIGTIANPASFTASNPHDIFNDLTWGKNAFGDDVIVAWSADGVFDDLVMSENYASGDVLPGGGTILYAGDATTYQHTPLKYGTVYYYKIWSARNGIYSSGLTASANTPPKVIVLKEDWDGNSSGQTWIQSNVQGTNEWLIGGNDPAKNNSNFTFISADGSTTAGYDGSIASQAWLQVEVDLVNLQSASLTFDWRCLGEFWSGSEVDYGEVYINDGGGDQLLSNVRAFWNSNTWQTKTIAIPNGFLDKVVTFKFYWQNDGGVANNPGFCIDNIEVGGIYAPTTTIESGAGVEPASISSVVDSEGEAFQMFDVKINDLISSYNDGTYIQQLVISQGGGNTISNWKDAIAGAKIYGPGLATDGVAGEVNSATLTFTGTDLITIPNTTSASYQLKIWLHKDLSGITDGDAFNFALRSDDQVTGRGDDFIPGQEVVSGAIPVDITTTALVFQQEPSQYASAGHVLKVVPVVAGVDENGNVDIHFTGDITLTNNRSISMNPGGATSVVVAAVNGVADYIGLAFLTEGVVTLSAVSGGLTSVPSCSVTIQKYCVPTHAATPVSYVNNLIFNTLNNTSGDDGGYGVYLDQQTALTKGVSYNMTLGVVNGSGVTAYAYAWMDWNGNEVFEAGAERYLIGSTSNSSAVLNGSIPVPTSAERGVTRMRIQMLAQQDPGTACDASAGESEDYLIEVTENAWQGRSTVWDSRDNWSSGEIPIGTTNVFIPENPYYGKVFPFITSTGIEVNNLEIDPNASVTINPGKDLTVNGDFINSGTLLIKSIDLYTGSFIDKQTISGSGKGRIEATLPSHRYWYMSHPLSGVNSGVYNAADQNAVRLYYYDRGWKEIVDNVTPFSAMQGVTINLKDPATIAYEGDLNTGLQTIALTPGYNLIGNPYPSAINWEADAGWNRTLLGDTYYIRTTIMSGERGLATYNKAADPGAKSLNGGMAEIPPLQSFWVASSGSGTLELNNAARLHKDIKLKSGGIIDNVLRMKLAYGDVWDETVVYFSPDANIGLEYKDSEKRFAEVEALPEIYSALEGVNYGINGLPDLTESVTIPLGILAIGEKNVELSFDALANFFPNVEVFVEDIKKGISVDMRKVDGYQFVTEDGNHKRLLLHVRPIATDVQSPNSGKGPYIYAYQNGGELMVFENLLADQPHGEVNIELYSIAGSKVLERTYNASGLHTLPANLASGTYLVKISAKNSEPHVVKVVIR